MCDFTLGSSWTVTYLVLYASISLGRTCPWHYAKSYSSTVNNWSNCKSAHIKKLWIWANLLLWPVYLHRVFPFWPQPYPWTPSSWWQVEMWSKNDFSSYLRRVSHGVPATSSWSATSDRLANWNSSCYDRFSVSAEACWEADYPICCSQSSVSGGRCRCPLWFRTPQVRDRTGTCDRLPWRTTPCPGRTAGGICTARRTVCDLFHGVLELIWRSLDSRCSVRAASEYAR